MQGLTGDLSLLPTGVLQNFWQKPDKGWKQRSDLTGALNTRQINECLVCLHRCLFHHSQLARRRYHRFTNLHANIHCKGGVGLQVTQEKVTERQKVKSGEV